MKFDTLVIGGGLAGLTAGISLQQKGLDTAIVSTGQSALHFFSGTFESLESPSERLAELFSAAGIRTHYSPGVRLMPLGSFRPAALSLEDVELFPAPHFADKVLIVNFNGYSDFFPAFLTEGLEAQGMSGRLLELDPPELQALRQSPSEMRSVQIARIMDRHWESVVQAIRAALRDEDAVILPQVFGLKDPSIPGRIRQELPVRVVFAGTQPPSVPGIRTQQLLRRRFELAGGTFLSGDEVVQTHVHDGRVHSVATRNLDHHYLEADHFILATGTFFAKGLAASPSGIRESVFGLDVDCAADRNAWYDPSFAADQPYLHFGVRTDAVLHAVKDGTPMQNLYAVGSILGGTRPEFGSGAGLAVRSAFAAVDQILNQHAV